MQIHIDLDYNVGSKWLRETLVDFSEQTEHLDMTHFSSEYVIRDPTSRYSLNDPLPQRVHSMINKTGGLEIPYGAFKSSQHHKLIPQMLIECKLQALLHVCT